MINISCNIHTQSANPASIHAFTSMIFKLIKSTWVTISFADFDWTLYLGLAFITAVFFAFGAALICCARRGIRVNQHYGMTRTGTVIMHTTNKARGKIIFLVISFVYSNGSQIFTRYK